MDLNKMIASLHQERRRIDEIIRQVEQLGADMHTKRRGRPAKRLQEAKAANSRKKTSFRRKPG
jgi:hypothetical protein